MEAVLKSYKNILLLIAIAGSLMACKDHIITDPPPTLISVQLSVSVSGATIWQLDPAGDVVSDTTLATISADLIIERGVQTSLLVHKSGFQTSIVDFKAFKDSSITITLTPVLQHKEIAVSRRLTNGTIQDVTTAVADLLVRGINVESVEMQSSTNTHSIPIIHNASFNVIIHAVETDSATVAFATSVPAVTSVILNHYPSENLILQVWEYMTNTRFLHNTATITEKKSGMVAVYDPIHHVYRMSPRTIHRPYAFEVAVPNYNYISQVTYGSITNFMMQSKDAPLVELFSVSVGDRWAFQHNSGTTPIKFEHYVFTNKTVVGTETHYELRVEELSREISGSDTTWSVLSSTTGTIIETEHGFWIDPATNPVLTFKSVPANFSSSNTVILASGTEQILMPLPLRLTRKVRQHVRDVQVVSYLAGGSSHSIWYDETGLKRWNSRSGGGNSGSMSTTIERIPPPIMD
jgi:hypothetical protein